MISLQEFGDYAGISPKAVRGMVTRGQLQAQRLGRQWRIPRAEAFRVLGIVDPEGQAPAPITLPRRRPALPPAEEAGIQRLLARGR